MSAIHTIECVLAIPAICFLAILLIPVGRKQLRARFAPQITSSARKQVDFVLWVQRTFRQPSRDRMIKACAWTVTVDFYVIILPGLYFSGLRHECFAIVGGMALVTYATCGMKDLLCSPRPVHVATPEQRKKLLVLETNLEVEYGTPSMHTSLATFMNVFLVYIAYSKNEGSPVAIVLYVLSALWAAWIAATRLYLGVHTPVDLMWGATFGVTFFALARLGAWAHLRAAISVGPAFGLARLAFDIWALLSYPKPAHYTTSSQYAATFLGAWSGFTLIFSEVVPSFGTAIGELIQGTTAEELLGKVDRGPIALRVLSGLIVVAVTRVMSKALLQPTLHILFTYMPSPIRRRLQPPISIRWLHATNYCESDVHDYSSPSPSHKSLVEGAVGKEGTKDMQEPSAVGRISSEHKPYTEEKISPPVHRPTIMHGWAVTADGYPLDADFWRRFVSYCVLVFMITEWDALLVACGTDVFRAPYRP